MWVVAQTYKASKLAFYDMNRNQTLGLNVNCHWQTLHSLAQCSYGFLEFDKLSAMWLCTCFF